MCVKDRGLHSQKINVIIFLHDSLVNSIHHMWKFRKKLKLKQKTLFWMLKYCLSCVKTCVQHTYVAYVSGCIHICTYSNKGHNPWHTVYKHQELILKDFFKEFFKTFKSSLIWVPFANESQFCIFTVFKSQGLFQMSGLLNISRQPKINFYCKIAI